jgi:hypothetical protein
MGGDDSRRVQLSHGHITRAAVSVTPSARWNLHLLRGARGHEISLPKARRRKSGADAETPRMRSPECWCGQLRPRLGPSASTALSRRRRATVAVIMLQLARSRSHLIENLVDLRFSEHLVPIRL